MSAGRNRNSKTVTRKNQQAKALRLKAERKRRLASERKSARERSAPK